MRAPGLRPLHRWGGLLLGAWLAIAGLSGSVLVWWHELADPHLPTSAGPPLPLAQLLKQASAQLPPDSLPYRLLPGATPGAPVQLLALDAADRRLTLWLDPATAEVLYRRAWGDHWVHQLYNLHAGATLGEAGKLAAGLAGPAMLALLAAGLALWLRRHGLPWAELLRPVRGLRGLRRQRNRHRALGFWALPALALAAATGTTLSFPEATRAALAPFLAAPQPAREKLGPLTLDAAIAAAEARLPGHRLAWLDLPDDPAAPYAMALLPRDGRVAAPARLRAWLRPGLLEHSPAGAVEQARAWFMALHNGAALGLAHRLAITALGLAPAVLWLLGLAMGRRRRLSTAGQPAPRGAAPARG